MIPSVDGVYTLLFQPARSLVIFIVLPLNVMVVLPESNCPLMDAMLLSDVDAAELKSTEAIVPSKTPRPRPSAKVHPESSPPYVDASDVHVEWKVAPTPPEVIKVI